MDTTDVPREKETRWRNVYCGEPDGEVLIDAWSPDSDTSARVDLLLSSNDRLNHSSLASTGVFLLTSELWDQMLKVDTSLPTNITTH